MKIFSMKIFEPKDVVVSIPTTGYGKVNNIYYDPTEKKLVVVVDKKSLGI